MQIRGYVMLPGRFISPIPRKFLSLSPPPPLPLLLQSCVVVQQFGKVIIIEKRIFFHILWKKLLFRDVWYLYIPCGQWFKVSWTRNEGECFRDESGIRCSLLVISFIGRRSLECGRIPNGDRDIRNSTGISRVARFPPKISKFSCFPRLRSSAPYFITFRGDPSYLFLSFFIFSGRLKFALIFNQFYGYCIHYG